MVYDTVIGSERRYALAYYVDTRLSLLFLASSLVVECPHPKKPAVTLDVMTPKVYAFVPLESIFVHKYHRASQKSFSSSPPRPKKEEKSVLPVGRGRAQPATRSLLMWAGGLLPIRASFAKPCKYQRVRYSDN